MSTAYLIIEDKWLPAIEEGDVETVKSLINAAKRVRSKVYSKYRGGRQGNSLLHIAVCNEQEQVVNLLLNYFDVNLQNSEEETPLMLAAATNQKEIVQLLLNNKANINIQTDETLYTDCSGCSEDIKDDAKSALILAVAKRHEGIVEILLKRGAEVMIAGKRNWRTYYELAQTWVHIFEDLVRDRCENILDLLMTLGPDAKRVTVEIFFHAIGQRKVKLFEKILKGGIDVEVKGIYYRNKTPLMIANNCKIVQILLNHGANVNASNDRGNVLCHAMSNGANLDVVRLLFNNGANIVQHDDELDTLSLAILHKKPKIVSFLLGCGAQLNIDSVGECLNIEFWSEWLESIEKIMIVLSKYIVIWQSENNFVTPLDSKVISSNALLKSYYDKCNEEMKQVKAKKFNSTTFSLYDILKTNPLDHLASYTRTAELEEYLKTESFNKDFPIYADLIVKQFEKGVERKILRTRVCNFFQTLSTRNNDKLPRLTIVCTNKIFGLLSNKDLSNLRLAYY